MNDLALNLLLEKIISGRENPEEAECNLWILDENLAPSEVIQGAAKSKIPLTLICNRFDLQQQLKTSKVTSTFSDFDFSGFEDNSVDRIFYRVSKEKTVVHHIVNQAFRVLKPGGELAIAGYKNEGAKTYIDKASKLFNGATVKTKGGQSSHLAVISKGSTTHGKLLDDKDYAHPRNINAQPNDRSISFISKPGQFGWNKADRGSELLIQHLPGVIRKRHTPAKTMLDLGCGYGYLSLMAASLEGLDMLDLQQITATDNNAAAILCCEQNLKASGRNYNVIADNCAHGIRGRFDLVLCNPPFHQGFAVDNDLTRMFLEQAHKRLHAKGDAVFVVNQFIPLERKAQDLFGKTTLLAESDGFKVIQCKR
jgi:16S rRNA (guanine1207-N2)-methyltransferase